MGSKLGFIGCGNMGAALCSAASRVISGDEICVSNRTEEKAIALAGKTGAQVGTNDMIASSSKYIILGVKPQMMNEVLGGIAPVLKERKDRFVLVTMAAGLSINSILEIVGGKYPVIRIMPNTAVAIGSGVILYTAGSGVTKREVEEFREYFKCAGSLEEISEELIDAGSVISGCGPAFAYMFIDALAKGGEKCGLSYEDALRYAAYMVKGAARMVIDSETNVDELIKAVCSPKGSTIEGVEYLRNSSFYDEVEKTAAASFRRTKELGQKK